VEPFGVAEKVVGVRVREFIKGPEVLAEGFAEKVAGWVVEEFCEEDAIEEFFKEGFGVSRGQKKVYGRIGVKRFSEQIVSEAKVKLKESVKKVGLEKAAVRGCAESGFVKDVGSEEVEVKGGDLREAVIQGVDFKDEFVISVKC
jgi:hypothetical protein